MNEISKKKIVEALEKTVQQIEAIRQVSQVEEPDAYMWSLLVDQNAGRGRATITFPSFWSEESDIIFEAEQLHNCKVVKVKKCIPLFEVNMPDFAKNVGLADLFLHEALDELK